VTFQTERNKKILALLKAQTDYLNSLPPDEAKAYAQDWLINKLGTHNPDGTLHKNYGGEE